MGTGREGQEVLAARAPLMKTCHLTACVDSRPSGWACRPPEATRMCSLLTPRTLDPTHLIHTVLPTGEQPIFSGLGSEGGGVAAAAGAAGRAVQGGQAFCRPPSLPGYVILTSFLASGPCFPTFMMGIKRIPPSCWHLGGLNSLTYQECDT